jgi:hypothetical protein
MAEKYELVPDHLATDNLGPRAEASKSNTTVSDSEKDIESPPAIPTQPFHATSPYAGALAGWEVAKPISGISGGTVAAKAILKHIADKNALLQEANDIARSNLGGASEHGFGFGAVKNAVHNVDQTLANQLHLDLSKNPAHGFTIEGNRRVITPTATPEELKAAAKPASKFASISSKVSPVLNNPITKSLAPLITLPMAGAEGVEAYNDWNRGNYGRSIIGGLGALGSAASTFPWQPPMLRAAEFGVGATAPFIKMGIDKAIDHKAYGGLVHIKK